MHARPHAAAPALRRRRALAALIAAAALAGCGGGPPAPPSPAASTFIDLVAALPAGLDPATAAGPAAQALETSLAGTLVRPVGAAAGAAELAPAGAVTGYLARSWTQLPNGDLLFELRRGVVSPYGHALSGADVRFSFLRALALSADARRLARLAGIVSSDPITVLGPATVRLNLVRASRLALAVVAGFRFGVLDSRAVAAHATASDPHARGWLTDHLAFYGAYELAGFTPGARVLLTANPRFWEPLAFSHVAIEVDRSAALRLADVAAGEASHTSALDPRTFATAATTNGLGVQLLPSTTVSELVPNERVGPPSHAAVRRAISLALDRAAIARAAFAGLAAPALGPLPSSIPLPAGVHMPLSGHDPASARALLARAGYPNGFVLTLAYNSADGGQSGSELALVAQELRPLRIAVRTRAVASDAALLALMRSGAVGGALVSAGAPIAAPAAALSECCLEGSPGNLGAYTEPALAPLVASMVSGDLGAQRKAVAAALSILAATTPEIPLVKVASQSISRAAISGYGAYAQQATYYDQLRR